LLRRALLEAATNFQSEQIMGFISPGDGTRVIKSFEDISSLYANLGAKQIIQINSPSIRQNKNPPPRFPGIEKK
jgi:hypothetical protein